MQAWISRGAAALAREILRQEAWNDFLVLQGVQAAHQLRGIERLLNLQEVEFKVFSQWGEDGIIEWLISRLPEIPQSFIEFGVEDYTEANTRFLLAHRNWRGLIIDGDTANIAKVRGRSNSWQHDLTALCAFVTRDNINGLISNAGFGGEIGLLSIDIDGNDYWVWDAITAVNPWIVIVEYNAVLGDMKPLTIPYEAAFNRMASHHSGLYWGASVAAFERLAKQRGYTLAGSNRAGNNLFFDRDDAFKILAHAIADRRARPSLYAEARDQKGALTFKRGTVRREIIGGMPVTDVATGTTALLCDMGELYSPSWIAIQQGKAPPEAKE